MKNSESFEYQLSVAEDTENTIGQEVAENYRKAEVFKKYNIDFCCGGNKTLSSVCRQKNLNYTEIRSELTKVEGQAGTASQNFQTWDAGFLADYIVHTHHRYVKSAIPLLIEYTNKVARVHGQEHPELIDIATLFAEAAEELTAHMYKEEQVLFPYIKQLSTNHANPEFRHFPAFSSAQQPIRMMELEHETVGELFKSIRILTDNYTPPAEACATYRVSFAKLNEFEEDLHQHIHLENNILFPKCINLEIAVRDMI
ncbi:MAG: iron-sulfur cluster repair di-iron protein [Bacteroidia bacterium]|nr:iron-sulfur cluster repair di-iron protein [Bacteroidia bacterium]